MDRDSVDSGMKQKILRVFMSVLVAVTFVPMGTAFAEEAEEAGGAVSLEEAQPVEESDEAPESADPEIAPAANHREEQR